MVTYESKQLTFVEVSLGFKEPDLLRRKQFEFEDAFKGVIDGPSMQLPQIPNPAGPLWMMTDNKTRLQATKDTITIINNLKVEENGIKYLIEKYSGILSDAVKTVLPSNRPIFIKVAGVSQWPSKEPASEVEKDIARRIIKSADSVDLSNANVTLNKRIKFQESQALVSYNIFAYKNIELKIDVEKNNPLPKSSIINETGLLARAEVSVNLSSEPNAPSDGRSVIEYFRGAQDILISCLKTDLPTILNEPNFLVDEI